VLCETSWLLSFQRSHGLQNGQHERCTINLIEFIIRAKGHFLLVNINIEYNKIIQQMAKKKPIKVISIINGLGVF